MRCLSDLAVSFVTACGLSVCCTPGCSHAEPFPAVDAACPPDLGLVVPACDRPATIDPTAIVDLASFRAQASLAICELSLRCGWGPSGDPFCHPSFAALDAVRQSGTAPFDVRAARTCVEQLLAAPDCYDALDVAIQCHTIHDRTGTGFSSQGDPCTGACSFDLVCVNATCATPGPVGASCDAAHPCFGLVDCIDGRCIEGSGVACLGSFGTIGPMLEHHVGCTCRHDEECPIDIARCYQGVCTLRPFAGDPCVASGPPCYGAQCVAGRCELFADGQGRCRYDTDCVAGLICTAYNLVCGPPLALGAVCGPTVEGECRPGYCDGILCRPYVQRGGPCSAPVLVCAPGLSCDPATARCA